MLIIPTPHLWQGFKCSVRFQGCKGLGAWGGGGYSFQGFEFGLC